MAIVEHVGTVGDFERRAHILLDQQNRDALRAHLRDDAKTSRTMSGRESLRRLVEQQEFGIEQQRAGDRQHLLLAAGELAARLALRSASRGNS